MSKMKQPVWYGVFSGPCTHIAAVKEVLGLTEVHRSLLHWEQEVRRRWASASVHVLSTNTSEVVETEPHLLHQDMLQNCDWLTHNCRGTCLDVSK